VTEVMPIDADFPTRTAPPSDTAAQQALVDHLFRHSLAAGHVHPLLNIVRHWHGLSGAQPARPVARPGLHADETLAAPRTPPDGVVPERIVAHIARLPALPQAVQEALCALQDEGSTTEQVADSLARDQALTARMLRIANSSFYGVAGRVATVGDAIGVLGLRTVAALLTAAAVQDGIGRPGWADNDFRAHWCQAASAALAARVLANPTTIDGGTAFTAGLLHNIGDIAMALAMPDAARAIREALCGSDRSRVDIERDLLGCDHAAVGALLARHWRLPEPLVLAIEGHLCPPPARSATLTDVVHLAAALAHAAHRHGSPHDAMPAVEPGAWRRLSLDEPRCLEVLDQVGAQVQALCEVLAP